MRALLVALTCALSIPSVLLSTASTADAQRRVDGRRHAHQGVRAELRQTVGQFRYALETHRVHGPLLRATRRFERDLGVRRRGRAWQQPYRELRRLVHRTRHLDDHVLDAWDGVVAAAARGRGSVVVRPPVQPTPIVHPPHRDPRPHDPHWHDPQPGGQPFGLLRFEGKFERTPVTFAGRTPDEVYQRCMSFTSAARLTHVDDVEVFGTAHRNGPAYWSNEALCSIAVLNTRTQGGGGAVVSGHVEGLPFSIPRRQAAHLLQRYLQSALQGQRHIDDIVINGQHYRNHSSYWSATEAAQIVLSQI